MSYGKVYAAFWSDEKVLTFSDEAIVAALYLLTGPHRNLLGGMRVPTGYLAADRNWTPVKATGALAELIRHGFIVRDDSGWTHIVNQWKYDPPENHNQVKSALKLLDVMPSGRVRASVIARCSTLSEGFRNGLPTVEEPLPTPEPAPEQKPAPAPAPEQEPGGASAPDPVSLAVEGWNRAVEGTEIRPIRKLTPDRTKLLRGRIADAGGIEPFLAALPRIRGSPFLRGERNGKDHAGWMADFNYVMKQANFIKLMEGGYDGRSGESRPEFRNGFAAMLHESGVGGAVEPVEVVDDPGAAAGGGRRAIGPPAGSA